MSTKYIKFKKSTYGNSVGDVVKIEDESSKYIYYTDIFNRYCYLNKVEDKDDFVFITNEEAMEYLEPADVDINVSDVVDFLNELIEIDRESITSLINKRVECNLKLAEHPTVQVGKNANGIYEIGLLGILNGLFGNMEGGTGYIYVRFDSDGLAEKAYYKV